MKFSRLIIDNILREIIMPTDALISTSPSPLSRELRLHHGPKILKQRLRLGRQWYGRGNFKGAVSCFADVVRAEPNNLPACVLLVKAYQQYAGCWQGKDKLVFPQDIRLQERQTILYAYECTSGGRPQGALEIPETLTIDRLKAEQLFNRTQDFLAAGNLDFAFLCAARLVRAETTNMAACRLLVDLYQQMTGYSGEISARALQRRLSPQERLVHVADRRLFVVNELASLQAEDPSRLTSVKLRKLRGSSLPYLIGGGAGRVFPKLADAFEAAGYPHHHKKRT